MADNCAPGGAAPAELLLRSPIDALLPAGMEQLREARRNGLLKIAQKSSWAMSGLRIVPATPGVAARDIVASIAGVTIFVLVVDGLLFRGHLAREYLDFYTSPLLPRVWVISAKAGIEEIKYRLVLMTGLALAYTILRGKLDTPAAVAIIIAAQFANVGNLVLADPLYGTLRYWVVGCVWGWLYWRHGWLAALVGHVATHPLLDPALMFVLVHFGGI